MRWPGFVRPLPPAIPSAPVWDLGSSGPRVLVEVEDPVLGWAYERMLSDAGYEVMVCGGPGHRGGHCPLLSDRVCLAARDADAIVFGLSLLDPTESAILRAHHASQPEVPVCAVVSALSEGAAPVRDQAEVISSVATRRQVLGAVDRLIGQGRRSGDGEKEVEDGAATPAPPAV